MSIECRFTLPPPLDKLSRKDQITRTRNEGETLFNQDSPTGGIFYLVVGAVDLTRSTHTGHTVVIHRARAGDTFAEASLFSTTYHCTATALQKSKIIECRRTALLTLFNSDIDFARTMAAAFAKQIQESRRRVELLSIRAADQRILAALKDGLLIDDIATFADLIGLAPETVYRCMGQLTKAGHIQKTARGQYRC